MWRVSIRDVIIAILVSPHVFVYGPTFAYNTVVVGLIMCIPHLSHSLGKVFQCE
jgi:hypothetical protein